MKTATARASRAKTSVSSEAKFFKDLSLKKDVTTSKDVTPATTLKKNKLQFKVKVMSHSLAKTRFTFLNGINRLVDSDHVNRMISSIRAIGVIRPIIVTKYTYKGVKGYYILDGQNLFTGLIKLKMDVPYIEVSINSDRQLVETIALLNNSSRSWTLWDYVNSWSHVKDDYIKLLEYSDTSTIELRMVACVLNGMKGYSSSINRIIKLGKFSVDSETKAVKALNYMTEVFSELPPLDRGVGLAFKYAYMAYMLTNFSTYSHNWFRAYLKKNKKLISQANSDKSKIEFFFKMII
jgi:hypothetical protein